VIGVFDSGIGGLTVAKAMSGLLPDYPICYFGDTARTPYGTKSPQTVIGYCLENTRFLIEKGATMIVVACNTASSVAAEALRQSFDVPILEVITPAVEMAISDRRARSIGVIGTRATVKSGVYEAKIAAMAPDLRVHSVPCPLLVPLVEEGWLTQPETRRIVKKYLHPLKTRQIDTLILGCTHYPILKEMIQEKIGKRVRIIDSSIAVVKSLESYLQAHPEQGSSLARKGTAGIFVSDVTEQFQKVAQTILRKRVVLQHVSL